MKKIRDEEKGHDERQYEFCIFLAFKLSIIKYCIVFNSELDKREIYIVTLRTHMIFCKPKF